MKIIVDVEKSEKQKRATLYKPEDQNIQTKLGLKKQFHKIYELKTKAKTFTSLCIKCLSET